ncbi:MAG: DUF192 domain-containing protein [Granulosicoccus sp.]
MHGDNSLRNAAQLFFSGRWRHLKSGMLVLFMLAGCLLFFLQQRDAFSDDSPQPRLPTIPLQINGKVLIAEVAATPQQRYMGLSFRQSLAKDEGMLFFYPSEQSLTFTMRNTLIPLSIAFISKDLVINEIHHMDVGPGQLFHSKQKAQYALEVDQGWFADNGISVGDQIIRP